MSFTQFFPHTPQNKSHTPAGNQPLICLGWPGKEDFSLTDLSGLHPRDSGLLSLLGWSWSSWFWGSGFAAFTKTWCLIRSLVRKPNWKVWVSSALCIGFTEGGETSFSGASGKTSQWSRFGNGEGKSLNTKPWCLMLIPGWHFHTNQIFF